MTSVASEALANCDGVDQDCGGFIVLMEGGGPWGFSLQGGTDFRSPLRISRVGSHGKAAKAGLSAGNIIVTINGQATERLKHIEAQRLIKMSGDTLELHCSKVLPRVTSPGPTGNKPTFFFPQSPTTPSAGKSSTLGRIKATSQIQSTPIPLHPMRPRSSSDAKRQVKHASGIPMPTPPPSYRGHSHKHSIGSTGSDSMSSTSLSPMEAESPVSTWDQQPTSDTTSAQCPPDEDQDTDKDEGVQMDEEEPFQEKRKVAAKGRIAGWIDSRVLTKQQNKPEVDPGTTSNSVKEDSTKKDKADSQVTMQPPPFSPVHSEPKETKRERSATTSDVDSNYFLKTASGDWYKQMFQNLKQGVDGQFPDKKKVWDRSPTPVRKSSYEFKSSSDVDYVKSHSQRPAKAQSPQHSRSASYGEESATTWHGPATTPAAAAGATASKRMVRPSSSSTIPQQQQEVSPNMVFRKTSSSGHVGGSSVVYRKNSPGYSNSRDYWKQLERRNSQEALQANRRSSLTRGRSLSSSSTVSDVATSEQPNILQADSRITATPPESPFEQSTTLFEVTEPVTVPISDLKVTEVSDPPTLEQSIVSSDPPKEQSTVVTDPPEQSAAVVTDPPEQSAVVTDPPEQSAAVVTDPPEQSAAVVTDPPEQSAAVVTDPPEQSAVVTDPPEQSAAVVTDPPEQSAAVVTDPPEQSAAVVTDPPEQSAAVVTDPPEQSAAVVTDPPEQSAAVVTDPPEQSAAVVTDPPEQSAAVVTDPPEQSAAVSEHSSHPASPELDEVMSKLHPILQTDSSEEKSEQQNAEAPGDIFNRIDPTKLSNALGNAVAIGTMEQEGASPLVLQSAALMAGSPQPQQQQQQPKKKPKAHKPPPGEKAKGLHDFLAASEKELSFKKGDVLTLTRTVDQNWLEGTLNGKTGIFPNNFVKVLTAEEIAMLGQEQQQQQVKEEEQSLNQLAKAKYDFTAKTARELNFRKGEVITLLKQLDDNWYRGRTEEGEEGIVPSSYMQLLDNADQ